MKTIIDPLTESLAPGFSLRPALWPDLEAVCALIKEVCTLEGDPVGAVSQDEMRIEWQTPGFNLQTDAWVATDASGAIVGYEEMFNGHEHSYLRGDGYVHPSLHGRGIGTSLLHVLEARARLEVPKAAQGARVYLRNMMGVKDEDACRMHENEGYNAIRYSWRMGITLAEPLQGPIWPEGVELRPFVKGIQNRIVFETEDESFRDHWGHTPGDFDAWQLRKPGAEDFDPTLWYIAWEGDVVAGVSLCRYRQGIGWVGSLGVRRPWRKRGLGLALLQHSFGEFYRRGMPEIGLGVDASSLTGATRLYEKAGMHVVNDYVLYEKELRPGLVLQEQA